ncbi:MAG TPA: Rrf2 family transcriptional regulator [Opitutaceae bacterium]|nr:Rrf2 family transcriptional regulator [Opitutaceae bacterium]
MKITVKLDYTCRILCELARAHPAGEPVRLEHLANVEEVPANFLAQILGELKSGRLVVSKRGVQGGFLLARSPADITLLDIIETVEGGLLEPSGNQGGRSGRRMRQIWDDVRAAAAERAQAYTLEAMAARAEVEMYYI